MRNVYLLDEYEDDYQPHRSAKGKKPKPSRAQIMAQLADPEEGIEGGFDPTYTASRNDSLERAWIMTYLTHFYNDHIITDVLHQVKGGKEANVYCCEAHPTTGVDLLAAKLYRPREFRSLRNDAQYRQGRKVLGNDGKLVKNDRMLHAVAKGSSFGKQLAHTSWLAHEYQTLEVLHAAGADVPRPYAIGENVIMMEYLGEEGMPAPALHNVSLDRAEARPLFERLVDNIDLMLQQGRVHGDLSAFNILYWEGEIKIIDFPQAIDITTNRDAFTIFRRDVERVCQYFARYGVTPNPYHLATKLWRKYVPEDNFEALNLLAAAIDEGD